MVTAEFHHNTSPKPTIAVSVFYPSNARIDPTTQQLMGETCTCRYASRLTWLADNPVEVLNEHLSLLVELYVPTKVIRVRNKDKPWFDIQCMAAFGLKQEAHLR